MRCLTDNQLQQLIDGELSANQINKYKSHIIACPFCDEKYNERKELALSIKSLINETTNSPERIPEFRVPVIPASQQRKVRSIPIWVKAAALLIPAFFIWKFANKPQKILNQPPRVFKCTKCATTWMPTLLFRKI